MLQNGREGGRVWQVKIYPYEKGAGGAETVLAILKGGGGCITFLTRNFPIL